MHARVAAADRPAGAAERGAEDRSADECRDDQATQRQLEDPGWDRHEGTDDRRREADSRGQLAEAAEPALGAGDAFRRDVEPASVTLEQRMSAVVADRPAGDRADDVADDARDDDGDVRP